MIISPFYGGEGGAYNSMAAEGGMVVDTAEKGMREGRNWCLGWVGGRGAMYIC